MTVTGRPGPVADRPEPVPDRPEPGLERALLDCAAGARSGTLRVTGEPGGAVYLAGGLVTAISTPGSPDPEAILLRSGRIPEPSWSAAFAAVAGAPAAMAAELVRRDLIGSGELEALLRIGLADAMFAIAAGLVSGCELDPAPGSPLLPLDPGAGPAELLAEAARRIAVLGSTPGRVAHDRDRLALVPGAWTPRPGPGDGEAEMLALANGRRTARDMAFVLGRGVYAVTLQLARMRHAGVLTVASSRYASRVTPRVTAAEIPPAGIPNGADPGGVSAPVAGPGGDSRPPPLPRRRRTVGLTRKRDS